MELNRGIIMENEDQYDVIVIGAGLNGLIIGNRLAYNGYKTLIIDKNTKPGGYVQNFFREEFRFDVATQFIPGCGPGGLVYNVLETFDAVDLIEFKPIKNTIKNTIMVHKTSSNLLTLQMLSR